MRQSKFTETRIITILTEADAGRPVNEIWRHYGISSATYYKWKAKYGGLEASDVKRLNATTGYDSMGSRGMRNASGASIAACD